MSLFDKIKLIREYRTSKPLETVRNEIRSLDQCRIERINEDAYKLISNISFGTMPTKINPGVTVGIYLAATIRETDSQYRTIRFESPLRLEHIFIIIVFLLIAITASFRHQPPVAVIGFFAAWLFCHLWFHFLYRFQERSLLRKVVNNLSLAGD